MPQIKTMNDKQEVATPIGRIAKPAQMHSKLEVHVLQSVIFTPAVLKGSVASSCSF